jgi:hypothetical protein
MRWSSWNAGISARSMTTSSEMRSGDTRSPAKWLIVKLPKGWASATGVRIVRPRTVAAAATAAWRTVR